MINRFEEEYVFYSYATDDLREAFNYLKSINLYKRKLTISALIQIAIIAYSRPFKKCIGNYGRHKIEDTMIPNKFSSLHKKIITYRDSIFAHSDISIRKPTLSRKKIENKTVFSMTYRGFKPDDFRHDVNNMKKLIEALSLSLRLRREELKLKMT